MKKLTQTLLVLLSLFCTVYGNARTYYLSSSDGDDSYSSTQAQNPKTPWKTIKKLNSFFSNLQPGDSVLFKRDDVFYGSINVTKSGTSSNPIVLAAYGSGEKPVITSFVRLTNWTSIGGGIYESSNSALGAEVSNLLINNVAQELGRFPNSDQSNRGYLTIDSYNSYTSITDAELPSSPDWAGAEVVIRKNRWTIDRGKITNHAGTTIYYSSPSNKTPVKGFGYFVQNHIKTLDKYGEWYYNPSNKKMYVYFGSNFSTSKVVEASTSDALISSVSMSYVIVNGLTLRGANNKAVYVSKGTNFTIDNCDLLFPGYNGVDISNTKNFKLENSTILNANSNGVQVALNNSYPIIRYNTIRNTQTFPGMGGKDGGGGYAIQCTGPNSLIEGNTMIKSGFGGINFNRDYSVIKNNVIDTFGFNKDDGGGIYTNVGSSNVSYTGRKVIGNMVMNGVGAPEGTNAVTINTEGIYMDDNVNGVEISGNTITNCNRGLFIHNSRDLVISNNTVYDNNLQIYVKHDGIGSAISNVTMKGNIFFAKDVTQLVAIFSTKENDISNMGTFDNNYYCRPTDDDNQVIEYSYVVNGETKSGRLDLSGWQKMFNKDLNSKNSPTSLQTYTINSLSSTPKVPNGSFDSKSDGAYGSKSNVSWVSGSLLDKGYIKVTPTEKKSALIFSVGAVSPSKKYVLKFSVVGQTNNRTLGVFLRYGGSPYSPITPIYYRGVSTSRKDYEIVFTPTVAQSNASLVLSYEGMETYYVDNVKLHEADVAYADVNDLIKFKYNPSDNNKSVPLDVTRIDPKGKWYNSNISLQGYGSLVLMKSKSSTTVDATAPETSSTATLSPIADAFVRSDAFADSNFGKEATLITKTSATTGFSRSSYLKFSLSNINTVTSAKLRIYGSNIETSENISISAYGVNNDSWTETGITWNNAPSASTNALSSVSIDDANRYYELDVTDYIQSQLNGDKVASFMVKDPSNRNRNLTFNSRENGQNQPQLVLETSSTSAQTVSAMALNTSAQLPTDMTATAPKTEAIADNAKAISLSTYPNPVQSTLQVMIEAPNTANIKQLAIISVSGAVLKTVPVSSSSRSVSVDVSSLKSGIYIVNLYSDKQVVSRKFVKY